MSNELNMPKRLLRRAGNLLTPTGQPSTPALQDIVVSFSDADGSDDRSYANDLRSRRRSESGIGASIKRKLQGSTQAIGAKLARNKSASPEVGSSTKTSWRFGRKHHARSRSTSSLPSAVSTHQPRPSLQRPETTQCEALREASSETHDASEKMDAGEDVKVPFLLQQGTPMTKVSAKKKKTAVFRIDPDEGCIFWESKKSGIIAIEDVKELRFGADARYYREQFQLSHDYEERWITIVYIADGSYKTLHLVATTPDVFRMWEVTLRNLYAVRQKLMSGLGHVEKRQAVWERRYWKGADEQGDQRLQFEEVENMCKRLNVNFPPEDLLRRFQEADSQKRGYLDFKDFQYFVKLIKVRPEISRLYKKLCSSNNGQFDFTVFERFMREDQKSSHSTPELEKIFNKYTAPPPPSTLRPPTNIAPYKQGDATSDSSDSSVPTSPMPALATLDGAAPNDPVAPPAPLVAPSPFVVPNTVAVPATETLTPTPANTTGTPIPSQVPGPLSATDAPPLGADPSAPTSLSPNPGLSGEAAARAQPAVLTLDAFTSYLLSPDNSVFADHHGKVYQDMTRPLSEYYISSSHNTYLVGHQLVGVSTIEGYIRALLHSCRSVELDIYDGDVEPVIYHGKTFTSKVPLRDICQAIAKYAFVASPYPIIISAEVHCSLPQQDVIAEIMRTVFGDALVTAPIDGRPFIDLLPSPEDLKGRVLLKAKNLYVAEHENIQVKAITVDTESSTDTTSASDTDLVQEIKHEFQKARNVEPIKELKEEFQKARNIVNRVRGERSPSKVPRTPGVSLSPQSPPPPMDPPKVKMSFQLVALLVYTVGVKCRGFNKKEHYATEHVFSLSERTANKILKQSMLDLVKHNRTHVVRIYPAGTRLNSSNFEPHKYWSSGAQLVAINWQTFDLGYMINHAMFQRNGRTGFVLKPLALRSPNKEFLFKKTMHFLDVKIISAQQLPRPRDNLGREIFDKSAIDPYVVVSIHIPDWTHSPFLPDSAPAYSPPVSGGAAAPSSARSVVYKTGVVKNNGFNPVWEESLSLPFDCVGDMFELIFVKFAVMDEHGSDDEPLAVYCIPLGSIQPGYRHLPLHDSQMSQYLFSTLFVQISIRNEH